MDIIELLTGTTLSSSPSIINPEGLTTLLGNAFDIGKTGKRNIIYKYDNWQFCYNKGSLNLIAAYNYSDGKIRDLGEDSKIWKMTINSFIDFLHELNIKWEFDENYPHDSEQSCIKLVNGGSVYLDPELDNIYAIMLEINM